MLFIHLWISLIHRLTKLIKLEILSKILWKQFYPLLSVLFFLLCLTTFLEIYAFMPCTKNNPNSSHSPHSPSSDVFVIGGYWCIFFSVALFCFGCYAHKRLMVHFFCYCMTLFYYICSLLKFWMRSPLNQSEFQWESKHQIAWKWPRWVLE